MSLIFNPQRGRIFRFNDPTFAASWATITFPEFDYRSLYAIINASSLNFKPSYQASDTLGGDILLLTFGESLAPTVLSGMLFEDSCDSFIGRNGIAGLAQWWYRRNVSSGTAPVQITIGGGFAFSAFVADMSITLDDVVNRIWRFSMVLLRVPPRSESADEIFADTDIGDEESPAPEEEEVSDTPIESGEGIGAGTSPNGGGIIAPPRHVWERLPPDHPYHIPPPFTLDNLPPGHPGREDPWGITGVVDNESFITSIPSDYDDPDTPLLGAVTRK